MLLTPWLNPTGTGTGSMLSVGGGQRLDEHTHTLSRARQAYAAQDWATAASHFDAVAPGRLTADDLAAYADAVWWLGRIEDSLRLNAAACDAFRADSRPVEAAWSAMVLGIFHLGRGDEPQGMGWIGRAGRLMEGIPECPVHGYLLHITEVEASLLAGQHTAAVDAARRLQDLGRRLEQPDLMALGLNGEGRALIRSGHLVDGLKLLDEAMVTVLDGRLDPFASGTLYCHTIATCHEIADVRRMSRWIDLTERWLATLPAAVTFGSMCRVHRAQLQLLRGEWEEAERNALQVGAVDANRIDYAAEAWYVVAEARRLRGDPRAADAYNEAHARGRDPQPGRALLRLEEGDPAGAAASVRAAMAAVGPDPLRRAPLWVATVEIAVAAERLDDAAAAASELAATATTYATSGLEAMATDARGTVLLAEGRAEAALPVLRDACRRWHELGAPYDAARTSVRLAEAYRALGDEASAAAEVAQAEGTYERLGAHRSRRELPDGLTRREAEVLTLVADGLSNRQIAETLYISDRTVARHLTNIFTKIRVTSRTQAARYAIDRGMTGTE
jgi:DNA-binding NarL/FixJ family response regulator